jgi:hypothetical protein
MLMNAAHMTSVHALAQYTLAYNNQLYTAASEAIAEVLASARSISLEAAKVLPEYAKLANLLTDTALEICGHPAYRGVGWTLAQELRAISTSTDAKANASQMFGAVTAHLETFHRQASTFRELLASDGQANTLFLLEVAQLIADDAVQAASDLPGWPGRAVYHLLGACTGTLKTAVTILRYQDQPSLSPYHYAAEKLARALRDTVYGLDEVIQNRAVPDFFVRVRDALRPLVED